MSYHVDFLSVSVCDEMSEAVGVRGTGIRPAGRHNERGKRAYPLSHRLCQCHVS